MQSYSILYILFSAASGFAFTRLCYVLKYKVARESGYSLYLYCLSIGFLFFLLSFTLFKFFLFLTSFFDWPIIIIFNEEDKVIFLCGSTIFWSVVASFVYNKSVPFSKELNLVKVFEKSDFDSICLNAMTDFKPIGISLSNRKVYVGYVIDTLSGSQDNLYLTIMPIFSGYRHPKTLRFMLASKYQVVIDTVKKIEEDDSYQFDLKEYYMAIPREEISTIHIFNEELHQQVTSSYS